MIPVYRAQATIPYAIKSVLEQTYQEWEIIIGCDDQTDYLFVAKRDERISIVSTAGIGKGPGVARNVALDRARGEFIAILDADDRYHRCRLERLTPFAKRYGAVADNTGVVYLDQRLKKRLLPDLKTPRPLTAKDILKPRIPLFPIFHRDYGGKGWRETVFAEDVLFNLELLCRLEEYYVVPETLYYYHKTRESLTVSKDTPERAERGYAQILRLLKEKSLAVTETVRMAAYTEFSNNRALNKVFQKYRDRYPSLEEFLDASDNGQASWVVSELSQVGEPLR